MRKLHMEIAAKLIILNIHSPYIALYSENFSCFRYLNLDKDMLYYFPTISFWHIESDYEFLI